MRQFEAIKPVQTEVSQLRAQNQALEDEVAGLTRRYLETQKVSTKNTVNMEFNYLHFFYFFCQVKERNILYRKGTK